MEPRSGCPVNAAVEVLGDRWSLLVLRDVIFEDRRFFRALLTGFGRRHRVQHPRGPTRAPRRGRVAQPWHGARGQRIRYSLTESGIQTVPVLCALGTWGLTGAPPVTVCNEGRISSVTGVRPSSRRSWTSCVLAISVRQLWRIRGLVSSNYSDPRLPRR